jgi:TetR/AcrR family hemagglutinin/protease transcriptional regulator
MNAVLKEEQILSKPAPKSVSNKRTRLNPEKRQAQLLQCAVVAFAENGLARAVHADVAELAGVSVATVFNYFNTREDLVDAVLGEVEHFYLELSKAAHSFNFPAREALTQHGLLFIDATEKHQSFVKVWLEWTSSLRDDVWPRYLTLHNRVINQIARSIQASIDKGEVSSDLSSRELAMVFMGQAHTLAMMMYTPEATSEGAKMFVERTVNVLLGLKP